MFDLTKAPRVFHLTPEIIKRHVSDYRSQIAQVIDEALPLLENDHVPERNRAGLRDFIRNERSILATLDDMLANVVSTPTLVSRAEWTEFKRDFPVLDMSTSLANVRSAAFGDGKF